MDMKKNILWNTIGSIFYSGCQWLISIVVVWMMSYETAGYLGLAMTTSSSFSAISLFNVRNFQVSDVKGEYNSRQYVGSRVLTCITAVVCCSVYAGLKNNLYQALCIDAFIIIRLVEALCDVLHGVNQKFDRYDYIGKSYIMRGVVTIGGFILGLKITNDLLLALVLVATCNLLIAIVYDVFKTKGLENIKPEISRKTIEILKVCAPLVIFSFLLSMENLIPKEVLKDVAGPDKLGIYTSMASPTLVVQVFATVVFNPLLPGVSRLYNEGNYIEFRKMLHKLYAAFVGLSLVVTLGAMLFGRIGLKILFKESILEYYDLFMPIVWCTILTAVIWVLSAVLVAMRNIGWILVGMLVDFAICIGSVRWWVNEYGMNGVSFVQIFTYGLYILFMMVLCSIVLNKQMKDNKDQ